MDTFKIKAILTAARYNSLSKAAEEFSYTPSAFSHMTASLEHELGVSIFRRSNSGVTLTQEGKILCEKFEVLLKAENDIFLTAKNLSQNSEKEFRIVTYSSIARTILPKILVRLKKEHPDTRFNVSVADDPKGWLEDGKADIVLADNFAFSKENWTEVTEDKYYVVTPYGFTDKKQISLKELYDYPFIYPDDTFSKATFDKRLFREFFVMRTVDDLSIIKMIRDGMGISVLPGLLLEGNTDGLSIIEFIPETKRIIGYTCRKEMQNSQILKSFERVIKKIDFLK